MICNLFSTQAIAKHGYVIKFHRTDYTISKNGKIIVYITEFREMYCIVSSDSLTENRKIVYYTLSDIEL
jgi:hypothetical protein